MPHFTVSQIFTFDKVNQAKVTQLLEDAGIKRDANLDYTCGIFEEDGTLIATGSLFVNTLRCFAVCKRYTGEGLLNQIITHLISVQFERGNKHLFVYTKPESSKFFKDLGFYPIAEIPNLVTFMENRRAGFSDYLKKLVADDNRNITDAAAIVMNANPFTLGHLHLIEKAARENQVVHLFLVSEDTSLVPFEVRKALILAGTSHLTNIIYHETGSYIISQSTFPSYFQKDSESIIKSQAEVDLSIFTKIAKTLAITKRYVGEEPNSLATNIYNQAMQEKLPQMGIDCIVIPRLSIDGEIVSASTVRQLIKEDNLEAIKKFVPESTYQYFKSNQASEIIRNIQHETNVIHY